MEDRLKRIKKSIIGIQLMSVPANLAIALGLYGLYGEGGKSISILNDNIFCWCIIAVGAWVEFLAIMKFLPLWKEQAELKKNSPN